MRNNHEHPFQDKEYYVDNQVDLDWIVQRLKDGIMRIWEWGIIWLLEMIQTTSLILLAKNEKMLILANRNNIISTYC